MYIRDVRYEKCPKCKGRLKVETECTSSNSEWPVWVIRELCLDCGYSYVFVDDLGKKIAEERLDDYYHSPRYLRPGANDHVRPPRHY